jgi:hypothetical protein
MYQIAQFALSFQTSRKTELQWGEPACRSYRNFLFPDRRLGAHKGVNYGTVSATNALELPAKQYEPRAKNRHFWN